MSHDISGATAPPYLKGNKQRISATAAGASTVAVDIRATILTAKVIIIRASDAIAIIFGAGAVGAAVVDATSILFPGGEAPYELGVGETHFRVISVSGSNVAVQLEGCSNFQ